ncbi:MAG: hypothetical protein SFY69_09540 [Planctomycetota bacterium]|nr:hypothetical protein [Planctomycetota bacterium]
MIDRTFRRTVVSSGFGRAAIVIAGIACAGAPALAQQCTIPPEIVTAITLTPDAEAQLRACALENARDLDSPDAQKRRASRQALTRPLEDPNVSAAFRLRYSAALAEPINRAVASTDEVVAVNALVFAGELATDPGLTVLLDQLASPRPALRYQAAYGIRRTFGALQRSAPAIQNEQIDRAMRAARQRMGVETDGLVLQALTAALLEGASLPTAQFSQAQPLAVRSLSDGLSAHVGGAGGKIGEPGIMDAYLRGATGVRDIIAQPNVTIDAETARAVAQLGGRLIAYAVRVVKDKNLPAGPGATREQVSDSVALGQTLVQLAGRSLNQQGTGAAQLAPLIKAGDVQSEARFLLDAQQTIGANGVLTAAPFNFPDDHFVP